MRWFDSSRHGTRFSGSYFVFFAFYGGLFLSWTRDHGVVGWGDSLGGGSGGDDARAEGSVNDICNNIMVSSRRP